MPPQANFTSSSSLKGPILASLFIKSVATLAGIGLSASLAASEYEVQKTWEFGLGVGAVAGPDYRGSDESRSYVAPIPYVVYRGKIIQSDRDGVRGQFIKTDNYEFTLSLSANITPESHKNGLRRDLDLPELGSTIEIGPAVNIRLFGESLTQGLQLSLPARAVFSIGGDESGYIGSLFQPQLIYRERLGDWGFAWRSSLTWATEDYHEYYYNIGAANATEQYNAYSAKAGYSGFANQASLGRQLGDWRLAFFVRHDYLGGTEFENSPLVKTKHATRGGLALIWVFQ